MRTAPTARILLISAFFIFAGCSKTGTPSSSSPPATSVSPDATSSANSAAPAPGEPSNSVASAVPAASPAPTTAPAPPPRPPVEVEPGTVLTVTIDQTVGTKENSAGDRFAASLAEPVMVNGVEVLPAGTKATGTITQAESAGRVKGGAILALTLDSVRVHGKKYSVETSSFDEAGKGRGKRTAIGAGGGAAFGAIIGALAGGGKGAAIGAVAGGGAGTAGTAFTGKRDFTIPAETRLHFKLVHRLEIQR